MGFLLLTPDAKGTVTVFHCTLALMDPNNGGADLTLYPKSWQFPVIAFWDL